MEPTRDALKARLLRIAREDFPAAARAGKYPIRLDHCLLRVVYDHLFGAQWQTVLNRKQPAIHQLSVAQLQRAIEIAEAVTADRETCVVLNRESLAYRGKLRSDETAIEDGV